MLEIALDESMSGVLQKDIAEKQNISIKYLDQIIHALKASGLIVNVRGKKSGYILTRKPADVSMLDIHKSFEPGICIVDCLNKSIHCDREEFCETIGFWGNLNNIILDYFRCVSLQDIIDDKTLLD